ncbi:metabotropic glutamate receptor 3-like [Lineus longissimus]|uniref:metabotropic glutamate receptor 3-like n=1 Tax=Lineus longissimus TaxID=88925 RepID=UPI002B4DE316
MEVITFLVFAFNWFGFSSSRIPDVSGYYPDISGGVEFEEGDVIISGLFDLHRYDERNACGSQVDISGTYRALAFKYAVDEINKRHDILPREKLGYVFLDCCKKGTTSLARSLYTVPDKRWTKSCPASKQNQSCLGGFDYFPIVGSIGPQSSLIARLTTSVLGLFNIPQISNYVTSDEFSSRDKYPYFLRTVPPDWFQVVAMKSLFEKFGWKYISAIYEDGFYGRAAIKNLDRALGEIGACFGINEMVDHATTTSQWNQIVDKIVDHEKAKVIVLFLYSKPTMTFIQALRRRNLQDEFIIIASDSISVLTSTPKYMDILPEGMMGVAISGKPVPDFNDYFKSFNTAAANKTFILRDFWEQVFNCSLSYDAPNICHPDLVFNDTDSFSSDPLVAVVIDSVNVMASGIENVIKDKCPRAMGRDIRSCMTGSDLMYKLRNISYKGHTGQIEFNEHGDLMGRYDILNIQRTGGKVKAELVAIYDIKTERLQLTSTEIRWPMNLNETPIPESLCSKPCLPGHQKIQRDVQCCWECRPCRENEFTVDNRSKCVPCTELYWPDQETVTTCIEIEPVVLEWGDVESIVVMALTAVGLVLTLVIFVLFTKYRDSKLIKAASIELMYMILWAIFWSLLMVFSFLSRPDDISCYANFFGFNVSFASSYAPLLVKARRIFAIFASGKKTTKAPPMISSQSQVVLCLLLILVQILICVTIALVDKPFPQKLMPVATIKMVELGCHASTLIILVPLSYNLILLIACAIYAFKSRGIPANFNETRFISFSVYTTLILWMALLPTYYTANNERFKTIYLTLAMIIHAYLIQMSLFLPKLYAVMYLKEDEILVQGIQGRSGSNSDNGPSIARMRTQSDATVQRYCLKNIPQS